ncbi:cytochrome C [Paracoccus aestuarii]|uniref:Cytochrome C n=1 Tax=Paracoccus aestuarii TaxID=453842 RepID=A0A418ZSZ9_9RHOB|nr:c-type cytochrome [Paracoccus aestuarii]RJL00712.1 cytochrome C [Paracoccus aestuarii]WCQ98261.1 cytochrome C [Paracoccus aestuarii]
MRAMMMAGAAGLALAGLVAACAPEAAPTGAARDYAQYCADCHGPAGRGNGPAAVGMTPAPSDLTQLAANAGGVYPAPRVMGQLVGYTMGRSESHMPVFETLREGPVVMYDDGSGQRVATPARLVALADYIRTLQR